jgi:hypothetical protein
VHGPERQSQQDHAADHTVQRAHAENQAKLAESQVRPRLEVIRSILRLLLHQILADPSAAASPLVMYGGPPPPSHFPPQGGYHHPGMPMMPPHGPPHPMHPGGGGGAPPMPMPMVDHSTAKPDPANADRTIFSEGYAHTRARARIDFHSIIC